MATPAEILAQVSANKNKSSNELIMEKSKGTLSGAVIGGAVGLLYAFSAKKSYLVFGMIGIVVGGLVSNFFLVKEISKP